MDRTHATDEGDALAEALTSHLKSTIAEEYPKLCEIWSELWDSAEKKLRKEMLQTHLTETVSNLMESILNKEQETKEDYIARIEVLLDEIGKLKNQLGVKVPYDDVEALPLHCMAKSLNQTVQKYRQQLAERLNNLNVLRAQEAALVDALGTLPAELELPEVPTEEELESLQHHVQALEFEKMNRMVSFMEKRQRIQNLFHMLGSRPSLHFEKDVVSESRSAEFKVTNENMEQLEELQKRLEKQLVAAQERREDVVATLRSMWDYLEEPMDHQNQLLADHPGCTPEDLSALQAELERCKKEKSANIGKFVERVRAALVTEWDRCLVGQEVRDQFRVFRLTYYNEDMYDLHELELARWQRFYAENQRIFELYAQHNMLFEKLLELNGRGKSANRYHNRGGQLLQEERQRKMVAKDLPRVGEDLRSAVLAYEAKHGEPFTAFGRPLVEVVDEKWEAHFDQKTIDKFRYGSSACKGRTPIAVKRPAATSSSTGGKMSRLAPPSSTRNVTRSKRCLYRLENDQHQPEPDSTFNLEPSYEDFQKTLKAKLGVNKLVSRSTEVLAPGKVLRERNAMGLVSARSSPALAAPAITKMTKTTPKTVPRMARGANALTRTPVARTRLPIIL